MFTQRIFNMIDDKERTIATTVFLFLIIAVVTDLALDGFAALEMEEVVIECLIIFLCLAGLSALNLSVLHKSKRLKRVELQASSLEAQLEEFKQNKQTFIDDFQAFIDLHFKNWGLTQSQKDVGTLLVKGLNFEEIANIRGTKSATVRNQAHKIYDKSGLVGRHELAAYFLEELFQ